MEISVFTVGRRKESVARLQLQDGTGKILINGKTLDKYFVRDTLKVLVKQPLDATKMLDKFDIDVDVSGGGISSQAEAIRHALARALVKVDETIKPILRKSGFLTRDPRMRERKKYGQEGARKRFQWTKR
ncbi:30S ribosomal protein S9 [bacterium Unc6]|nr:30S ribosomal protein S9 [bacterium Unc6]